MKTLKKFIFLALMASSLLYLGCGLEVDDTNTGGTDQLVADAGDSLEVPVGALVMINGSSSTSNSGAMYYYWSFASVPEGSTLTSADLSSIVNPTFTPDKPGTYVIGLVVSDGATSSSPDYVFIAAGIPLADAGSPQTVQTGALVTLDASASSLFGGGTEGLTYLWSFDYLPAASLLTDNDISNTTVINPTFTPDAVGNYKLSLIVNDGVSDSAPDQVTVYAINTRPIANAGSDLVVTTGIPVHLDGTGSYDSDGDIISYLWSFYSVPFTSVAALLNSTTATPTFTPDLNGSYMVKLIVNDGIYDSYSDYVLIASGVPLADAGPNQTMTVGTQALLDGSGSADVSGGGLTYLWTFDSVPAGSSVDDTYLSDTAVVGPSFTPDVLGDYVLSLVVTENGVDSAPDTVIVTASYLIADLSIEDAILETCITDTAATLGASYASQLSYLNCSSMGISNVGGIGNLINLTYLYLNGNSIANISGLSPLVNLYDLRMNMNIINDISALSGMTDLYYLDLIFNDINDISVLSGLTNLRSLGLDYNNKLSDISVLSGLTNLTTLGLSGTSVTDITSLSGLSSLEGLGLGYNNIPSISLLTGLTNLTVLNLNNTGVSDISGLSSLNALETLHLEYNNITDISALAGMTNMTDLQLRNNTGITDISALTNMDELERVDLYYCDVTDISALSGKYKLTNLDLNSNNASDISPLTGMSNINALSLQNNGISDISALSSMTDMRLLYISGNSITDISALSGMTLLSQLYISGNNIVDVTPLSYATSLLDVLLGNNSITTGVDTLTTLTIARDIDLTGNDSIPCADLATLTGALGAGVVTEPASCYTP